MKDAILSTVSGRPQAWVEGKWYEKFGMAADTGVGAGDSLEQVVAFTPTLTSLQGYAAAVREKTLAILPSLSAADLDRELPARGGGPRKVGEFLGILMIDHFQHSGQIAYLRGYLTGKGWFPR